MRLLTLLRHGKSDWNAAFDSDYDRPLAERGRRDSPFVGEYFADLELVPDLIVSSPAERARQTAQLFAEGAGYGRAIRWEDRMYAASSGELMSVLRTFPDDAEHVLMIGHNPGFEDLAARLIGADAYGMALGVRLPTAAAAHIQLDVDAWNQVQANRGQLQWLVTPKMLRKVLHET
ncbi:MAG: SixA phosphatase family protein [Anaerolineae bacterium]|jgi:phosphohistidine phosphatase